MEEKRELIIRKLIEAGEKLALNYGFTLKSISEDTSKGIWGPEFVKFLKDKYGQCTNHIYWYDPNNNQQNIEFRFRFANPCLAIKLVSVDGYQIMAEVELSNWNPATQIDNGKWRISQMTIWDDLGYEYNEKLFEIARNICDEVNNAK